MVCVCARVGITHRPSHATQGQIGYCIVVPLALAAVKY